MSPKVEMEGRRKDTVRSQTSVNSLHLLRNEKDNGSKMKDGCGGGRCLKFISLKYHRDFAFRKWERMSIINDFISSSSPK